MREYILVDGDTGLIYGPYESCEIARARAEAEALATWEIVRDDEKLIDWSHPTGDVSERPKCEPSEKTRLRLDARSFVTGMRGSSCPKQRG